MGFSDISCHEKIEQSNIEVTCVRKSYDLAFATVNDTSAEPLETTGALAPSDGYQLYPHHEQYFLFRSSPPSLSVQSSTK